MTEIKQCTLQIEDLRCGNLVNYKGKPVMVDIHVLQEIRGNNCDYTPIELTGEVLQKCRIGNGIGWSIIVEHEDEWSGEIEEKIFQCVEDKIIMVYRGIKVRRVKHLHQFQNLFFVLIGDELKVTLAT